VLRSRVFASGSGFSPLVDATKKMQWEKNSHQKNSKFLKLNLRTGLLKLRRSLHLSREKIHLRNELEILYIFLIWGLILPSRISIHWHNWIRFLSGSGYELLLFEHVTMGDCKKITQILTDIFFFSSQGVNWTSLKVQESLKYHSKWTTLHIYILCKCKYVGMICVLLADKYFKDDIQQLYSGKY